MVSVTSVDRSGLVVGLLPVDATAVIAAIVAAMLVATVVFFVFVAFAQYTPWWADEFDLTGEDVSVDPSETAGDSESETPAQDGEPGASDDGTESIESG